MHLSSLHSRSCICCSGNRCCTSWACTKTEAWQKGRIGSAGRGFLLSSPLSRCDNKAVQTCHVRPRQAVRIVELLQPQRLRVLLEG